ncbi:ABC transporter permease subunit [Alteromonas aestuariivivens]|uniref:ABC transporter permease subunit n=1 Tax=Alteromonas aestuariivivens TaxID=1938339 RepID=A0A3D8ME49_9ALTE|nr:ABC transporter permease subunit [Alteromonas aestuariivivens]RDV28147.1 ABC transporter permease subunit [Alteromonas aestuariivivens]
MNSPPELRQKVRDRTDSFVRVLVSAFGGLVLLTLVILIVHLIYQAMPLAYTPKLEPAQQLRLTERDRILAAGDIVAGQPLITAREGCRLSFYTNKNGVLRRNRDYVRPCGHELGVVTAQGLHFLVDISPSGQVRIVDERALQSQALATDSQTAFPMDEPASTVEQTVISFSIPEARWQQRESWQIWLADKWVVVQIRQRDEIFLRWVNIRTPTQRADRVYPAGVNVLPLPGTRQTLVESEEQLSVVDLKTNLAHPLALESPVVWWQSLPKDRSVLIADEQGNITRWVLQNEHGQLSYAPTYQISLEPGTTPLMAVPHASSNAMALLTSKGKVMLINRITGEVLSVSEMSVPASGMSWFGKRLYTYGQQHIDIWQIQNLSGFTTWSSLFEAQTYEGYLQSETVWQTTSASDYQEAKYSIVPLLMGSLKASLMALVIAIPMSVGAAVYTAYFATSRVRQGLKPTIELLEAIPSVLIGFIAAIWLAPLAESFLFSFALFVLVVPLALFLFALVQPKVARRIPVNTKEGTGVLLSGGVVLLLGYVCFFMAPGWFFHFAGVQDFQQLTAQFGSPAGKNTLVVAIALGVAISPSIYSLAEDAIAGVPKELKLASFALGATRLQTLQHVVLKVAMPGVLAAIMLGFGRAFGETMIVLMVTGNTPVSSWDLFEGLRALTANLAIELPEADVGSVHYQILFFTACILFAFTFIVNTCAELLRQRLRRQIRYV